METIEKVAPETLLKYANQWIALSPDHTHILAAGQNPQEVERKLKHDQIADAVLKYVPAPDRVLSPLCRP